MCGSPRGWSRSRKRADSRSSAASSADCICRPSQPDGRVIRRRSRLRWESFGDCRVVAGWSNPICLLHGVPLEGAQESRATQPQRLVDLHLLGVRLLRRDSGDARNAWCKGPGRDSTGLVSLHPARFGDPSVDPPVRCCAGYSSTCRVFCSFSVWPSWRLVSYSTRLRGMARGSNCTDGCSSSSWAACRRYRSTPLGLRRPPS